MIAVIICLGFITFSLIIGGWMMWKVHRDIKVKTDLEEEVLLLLEEDKNQEKKDSIVAALDRLTTEIKNQTEAIENLIDPVERWRGKMKD